jgi:hypothetical protein
MKDTLAIILGIIIFSPVIVCQLICIALHWTISFTIAPPISFLMNSKISLKERYLDCKKFTIETLNNI